MTPGAGKFHAEVLYLTSLRVHTVQRKRYGAIWKVIYDKSRNNKKGHLWHRINALFSIQYYDYWCWVDCKRTVSEVRVQSSRGLCTNINLCDNNTMMGPFYMLCFAVLWRKSITRKKNNNHKMNEKCSVGSSSESCQICIIIAHHHLPWWLWPSQKYTADHKAKIWKAFSGVERNKNKPDLFSIIEDFYDLLQQSLFCFWLFSCRMGFFVWSNERLQTLLAW